MSFKTKNIIISALICLIVGGFLFFIIKDNKDSKSGRALQDETLKVKADENVELKNNKNFAHMIKIETNYGEIVFSTYDEDAPKAVNNFIDLSEKGFYNNVIFHRVISGFMIQGGDPTGTGMGGPGYEFADELNSSSESYKNGYKKGVVAMANHGPNTNGSQFFIMLEDYPLPNLYTIFGKVIKGQEVVDAIGKVKTDKNDKPLSPVIIKKVIVEPDKAVRL